MPWQGSFEMHPEMLYFQWVMADKNPRIKNGLEERLAAVILPYMVALDGHYELGEPEFDACCNPADYSKFFVRKLLSSMNDDRKRSGG
jgi:hypothetical protein